MALAEQEAGPQPQHMVALRRANEVRLARAEVKRQIADGERSASSVILDPPQAAEGIPVGDVLMAQTRWGTSRMRKLLSVLGIRENKPLRGMTDRQRRALAAMLDDPRPPAAYRGY